MLFYNFKFTKRISKSKIEFLDRIQRQPNGVDFIVNERWLLKNPLHLPLEKLVLYAELCSYRNYADYKLNGEVDVLIEDLPPGVDPSRFKPLKGSMVIITKTKIILKRETAKHG